jgi:hypothetical protein
VAHSQGTTSDFGFQTLDYHCRPQDKRLRANWTIRPKGLDHRASLVRVASLETGFAFQSAIEESETPASTSRHTSFGERSLFDQKLASFDERFAGAQLLAQAIIGGIVDLPECDALGCRARRM